MSFKNDAWPSSAAFDAINESLAANEAERKAAIKQAGAIFAFTLKNAEGKVNSWYIDLKDKGVVGQGLAPEGQKANTTLVLSDNDFQSMVAGKGNAQQMYMSGKLKIKGDLMKSMKLEPVLKRAQSQTKAKL